MRKGKEGRYTCRAEQDGDENTIQASADVTVACTSVMIFIITATVVGISPLHKFIATCQRLFTDTDRCLDVAGEKLGSALSLNQAPRCGHLFPSAAFSACGSGVRSTSGVPVVHLKMTTQTFA